MGRGSEHSRPGYGISPLGEVAVNLTIELAITGEWENRLLKGTNKTCANKDPGERSNDLTRD